MTKKDKKEYLEQLVANQGNQAVRLKWRADITF